jgi:hypothetical protein
MGQIGWQGRKESAKGLKGRENRDIREGVTVFQKAMKRGWGGTVPPAQTERN